MWPFNQLGCDMLLSKRLECDMLLFKQLECDLLLFRRLGCDMLPFELPTECQHIQQAYLLWSQSPCIICELYVHSDRHSVHTDTMLQMTKLQKSYVHSNIWNLIRISDSLSCGSNNPTIPFWSTSTKGRTEASSGSAHCLCTGPWSSPSELDLLCRCPCMRVHGIFLVVSSIELNIIGCWHA